MQGIFGRVGAQGLKRLLRNTLGGDQPVAEGTMEVTAEADANGNVVCEGNQGSGGPDRDQPL